MDSLIIEKLGSGYGLIGIPVLHDLLMINPTNLKHILIYVNKKRMNVLSNTGALDVKFTEVDFDCRVICSKYHITFYSILNTHVKITKSKEKQETLGRPTSLF